MAELDKVQNVVADAGAFIRNAPLQVSYTCNTFQLEVNEKTVLILTLSQFIKIV